MDIVQRRHLIAVWGSHHNKAVVILPMYSLKPHAETMQTLRRLMPQKELRKSTPRLPASAEPVTSGQPALIQVLRILNDSALSEKLPELYLEYGQIMALQNPVSASGLTELFQEMCRQISTADHPFDLHILDDG